MIQHNLKLSVDEVYTWTESSSVDFFTQSYYPWSLYAFNFS